MMTEPGTDQGYEPGNNTIQRPSIKAMLDELTTMPWCPRSKIVTDLERVRIVAICNMLGFQVSDPWTFNNQWDWPTYINLICKAWAYLGQVEFHQPAILSDEQIEYNRLQGMMNEQPGPGPQQPPMTTPQPTGQIPQQPAMPRKTKLKPIRKVRPSRQGWDRQPVTGVSLKQIRDTVGPEKVAWVLALLEKNRMDTIAEKAKVKKIKKLKGVT